MSQPRPAFLEELLRTGQIRKADALPANAPAPLRALSTGVRALDEALGGGLHRGQLTEIVAPLSAGGTAIARAALGAATRAGELCALIDPHDAFLPEPRALELSRLLWVRPNGAQLALKAAEIALEARFALVVVDLGGAPEGPRQEERLAALTPDALFERRRVERIDRDAERAKKLARPPLPGSSPWARLLRRAERQAVALLVLARQPQAGPFASATVELTRVRARWTGTPGTPSRLLAGASSLGAVVRSRRARPSTGIALELSYGAEFLPAEAR